MFDPVPPRLNICQHSRKISFACHRGREPTAIPLWVKRLNKAPDIGMAVQETGDSRTSRSRQGQYEKNSTDPIWTLPHKADSRIRWRSRINPHAPHVRLFTRVRVSGVSVRKLAVPQDSANSPKPAAGQTPYQRRQLPLRQVYQSAPFLLSRIRHYSCCSRRKTHSS